MLGNTGNMSSVGNAVLLKATIHGIAGELRSSAKRLVAGHAKVALTARAVEPLHTDVVTNLNVLDQFTTCDDYTSTFVATDQRKFGIQGPIPLPCVEIGMAN